ncbi:MAG TPA: hypothetical protein ENN24_04545 [Bacteroidetes bacterium]|nr:hypothetical protein [Bacteroidota bacterium]
MSVPMHKTSTPILWVYQQYDSVSIDDMLLLNDLYEPIDFFQQMLNEIDRIPIDVSKQTIEGILARIP